MGTEEKDLHDRLYVRDYNMWSNICNKRPHVDGKLSAQTINNGIILPWKLGDDKVKKLGGVHDENFNFIIGSAYKKERNCNRVDYGVINGGYSVPETELEYCDETVVYGGCVPIAPNESLFLFTAAFSWWYIKNPDPNIKIVFISASGPFANNQRLVNRIIEFEDLLGIPEERLIFCDRPTKFKTVIAPEPSVCAWKDYYDEYTLVFEKIRENVVPGNYKKVYLTRREYNKRGNIHDYINEEYFEDFYREKGFTIIAPEKHSLREQASIMLGADEIVSVWSSASHFGAAFSRPGAKLVYLNRIDIWDIGLENLPHFHQMKESDYYFIDVCYNFLNQSQDHGVYLLGPTSYWKKYVKATYGEEAEISDESVLEKHTYHYLKNWLLYCRVPSQYGWLKNTDNFDLLNNACRVILGQELDKSKYDVGMTKLELNRKVNELNRNVNELNAKLESANKELGNDTRLAKLSAIERQIGSVADVIQKAQLSSAERESLMKQNAALSAQIETQNNYIKYANISIEKMQENNKLLSELCKSIADKKDELAKANESMKAEAVLKDRKIVELTSDLANYQNIISDLKNESDTLKENMSADISSKEHQIEELNSSLADSKNVILNLQNDGNALKAHITNIENSRSWKITKPLRAIKRLFSKS